MSNLIRWQTRSEYSHVSIINYGGILIEALQGHGVIRNRALADVQAREDVDVVFVDVPDVSVLIAADTWLQEQIGKGYDYTMVARFVTRQKETRKSSGKWFCSELAFQYAKEAGVDLLRDTEAWEVSPGLFAKSPRLTLYTAAPR